MKSILQKSMPPELGYYLLMGFVGLHVALFLLLPYLGEFGPIYFFGILVFYGICESFRLPALLGVVGWFLYILVKSSPAARIRLGSLLILWGGSLTAFLMALLGDWDLPEALLYALGYATLIFPFLWLILWFFRWSKTQDSVQPS